MIFLDVYIADCPERTAERVRKWVAAIREEF